jgi:glycosyltransferase involved in cell wall biosynthesis
VVVTAYDQGRTVEDAVLSVLAQSHPVDDVVVVDDGSTDPESLEVLAGLPRLGGTTSVVRVLHQPNGGVSAARNTGVAALSTEVVAVLDGDDLWEPTFVEKTLAPLADDRTVAASSWLSMFGVAQGVVEPTGGTVEAFLPRNAAPASALVRRAHWSEVGGYDESMRQGFEDWDFFLRLLRRDGARVVVVPEPLLRYRTHPASANVRSMEDRLARYAQVVANHRDTFAAHLEAALLGLERTSITRLAAWEEIVADDPALDVGPVGFGDGGMAAAVRIASARSQT